MAKLVGYIPNKTPLKQKDKTQGFEHTKAKQTGTKQ